MDAGDEERWRLPHVLCWSSSREAERIIIMVDIMSELQYISGNQFEF
jgi:hypothetical protein